MERHKQSAITVIMCIAIFGSCATSQAKIIYVDGNATGLNNGSSWPNAYRRVQDATAALPGGQEEVEIRVAGGVYRTTSLWITRDVVLKGGYAGGTMPDPDVRDVNDYPTTLSGESTGREVIRVRGADITMDGFIITAGVSYIVGRAGPDVDTWGGAGLCLSGGNAKIINCTFMNNRADPCWGGAIFVGLQCHVEIVDSVFKDNYGVRGGALYNNGGNVDLYRCVFVQNRSGSGGAIGTMGGCISSVSCEFAGNSSKSRFGYEGYGGAATSESHGILEFESSLLIGNTAVSGGAVTGDLTSSLQFRNSLLIANVATRRGGAVSGRNIRLTGCTVVGNRAAENPDIGASVGGTSRLFNCIVWGNEKVPQQDRTAGDWLGTCSYCCLEPGTRATRVIGNIEENPAFALPGYWDPNGTPDDPSDDFWVDGDYHLKSQAGRWEPESQSWVMDDVTSPCIDAGDPNSPIGLEPEPNGGRINMGAYAGTTEASMTYYPGSIWGIDTPGDACKDD